ncbi:MAG: Smr/MutS family protein [Paludibacteraceae bacterium]|nr:Smr/MutS family protein [Paludibacteraceae bacterium]
MFYPENFEVKIGFDKIRTLVKQKCLSAPGEEKADAMSFTALHTSVTRLLAETEEMQRVLTEDAEEFPLVTFQDVREGLSRIQVEGLYLDAVELFNLWRSLEVISTVVRFIAGKPEGQYPNLCTLTQEVAVFPEVIKRIDAILTKFGKIKDNASPELSRIRKETFQVQGSVSRSLQHILRQAQTDGFVDKDTLPTVREGRLVIPVSPAYKRKLKGIVHDESATGKTVFIEPAEVVESNNRLRELEAEERREIIRILVDFANYLRPYLYDIESSYDFLATVDFIRAKACFALDIKAIKPVVLDECVVEWEKAVHPLLFLSLKKQGKSIVPLNITLTPEKRILLISGPNAGGKSVCLKTVGLLQYMLQCGMPIPVSETSRIGIFADIFIDIGDEQSIENDLSTYSSHLTAMKFFVKNTKSESIILIDEFGGGTEPQIGGAIAESLLERFNENKTFGVITTHYTNLKHFAEDAEGIVNGAMLYDRHHMQPLFQLEIGNPGSSFAIEIARKIGLPESVIQAATDKVGTEHIDYDKHLQDIVRDKRYWENKRQQVRQREKHLEELEQKYQAELQQIDSQRKEIVKKAKADATNLLSTTNARIENTIREIKEAQAEKEKTKNIRQELDAFKQEVQQEVGSVDAISRKIQKLKEKETQKQSGKPVVVKKTIEKEQISVGDNVRMKGQTAIGEVMELQEKTAVISFGTLKSTVKLQNLEKLSRGQAKKETRKIAVLGGSTNEEIRQRKLNFKQEIDVRGMRVDEALQAVTYFIDDALMINAGTVRILHGTGTGALRQAIRQYLATVQGIAHFHDEHVQLGGAGITVVEF